MAIADIHAVKSRNTFAIDTADTLGTTRFFGIGDPVANRRLSGWAAPEDNQNWNNGPEVGYILKVSPPPRQTCSIRVEGVAFIEANVPAQDITLYFNGLRLGWWRIAHGRPVVLEAEVEPQQWFVRDDVAIGNVRWHIPKSTSPRDIGTGSDERELGFCFRSIAVSLL